MNPVQYSAPVLFREVNKLLAEQPEYPLSLFMLILRESRCFMVREGQKSGHEDGGRDRGEEHASVYVTPQIGFCRPV